MNIGELIAKIKLDPSGIQSGLNAAEKAVGNFAKGFDRHLHGAFQKGFQGLKLFKSGVVELNQAVELGKNIWRGMTAIASATAGSFVEAASTAEGYRVRLNTLLGSVSEGNRMFKDMAVFAARVPYEYEKVMGAATSLAGVMRGGVDEVNQWMPMIADLAAATGLSIEEATGQVIRMYSAGAASADLFRERGVLAMLGFQSGVTYSAEETRKTLIKAYEDPASKFRGVTEELAKTWDGQVSMMKDKWFLFRYEVMDTGPFQAVKDILRDINTHLDQMAKSGELKKLARQVGDMALDVLDLGISAGKLLFNTFVGAYEIVLLIKAAWHDINAWKNEARDNPIIRFFRAGMSGAQHGANEDYVGQAKNHREESAKAMEAFWRAQGLFDKGMAGMSGIQGRLQNYRNRPEKTEEEGAPRAGTLGNQGAQEKNKEAEAAAKKAARELESATERLVDKLRQAKFDKDTLGFTELQRGLAEVDAEFDQIIAKQPTLARQAGEWRDIAKDVLKQQHNLEGAKEINALIKTADAEAATIGLEDYQRQLVEIEQQYQDLATKYPDLGGKAREWADKAKANAQAARVAAAKKDVEGLIKDEQFTNATRGMDEYQTRLAEIARAYQDIIDKNPGLQELAQTWRTLAEGNVMSEKTAAEEKERISGIAGHIQDTLGAMQGPLTEFLTTFAQTGKFAIGELVKGLLKQLQVVAAAKTAELLMTAAFEGIMAVVDYNNAAKHSAAAMLALKGAAVMGSFVLGSGLAGMAHSGMTSIPEDGTWLLQKGERVVDQNTNRDLKEFLKQGGAGNQVSMVVNIQGGDEQSVMKALPKLKQTIEEVVNANIANNGSIRHTIKNYAV